MASIDQMDDQKTHFRHILHFFFSKRVKTSESAVKYAPSMRPCNKDTKLAIIIDKKQEQTVTLVQVDTRKENISN